MRIVVCRLVPKHYCVNLFGTVWTRSAQRIDRYVLNHERIHTAQMRELLWVPFYLLYFLEWLVRLAVCRDLERAYYSISFEREAYRHGKDLGYLGRRRHFAQWRRAAR